MVCFRGVDVSLFAVVDREEHKVPEFPHPDGSSVNLSSTSIDKHGSAQFNSPRRAGSPLRYELSTTAKSNPKISVYVPSVPDTQFFFKYSINMSAPDKEKPFLFFKLFMNGQHIVAWGIDRRKVQSGETYRALYEPCEHFQHRENDMLLQAPGVEARHFKFTSDSSKKSVAEDGGLIELQVFRARARRRQPIEVSQYRHQEKYGISSVSDGLVDKPEDTAYYQWLLWDAVDSPYASFRFHYRTWENLRQLQLVRDEDAKIFSSHSATSLTSGASQDTAKAPSSDPDTEQFSFGLEDALFDDAGFYNSPNQAASLPAVVSPGYALSSPPILPPNPSSGSSIPEPSKADRDGGDKKYSQRPLPEIPAYKGPPSKVDHATETISYKAHRRSESAFSGLTAASRKSSKSSITSQKSIAPSLMPYVDDTTFLTDDIEIGVAKEVEVVVQHDPSRCCQLDNRAASGESAAPSSEWQTDLSLSEYSDSVLPSDDSANLFSRSPLPREYVALQQDADVHRFSSSPVRQPLTELGHRSPRMKLRVKRGSEKEKEVEEPVKLEEGTWMASRLPPTELAGLVAQMSPSQQQHLRELEANFKAKNPRLIADEARTLAVSNLAMLDRNQRAMNAASGEATRPLPPSTPPTLARSLSRSRRSPSRAYARAVTDMYSPLLDYRKSRGELLYQESLEQNVLSGRDVGDAPSTRSPRRSPHGTQAPNGFPSWI